MRTNLILQICLVAVLGLTAHAAEPLGHWPLDGHLDDVAGSANGDFFGGAPSYVKGKMNQAILFDGVDDYVEVMVNNVDAYTISAWIMPERTDAASVVVRTSPSGTTTHWSHQIRIAASGVFEHYLWDGSERTVTGTTPIEVGNWYFVAIEATHNGPVTLYVNGQEEGAATTVATMWADGDRYHIGSNSGASMGWFQGIIDDVRIYDHILTLEEIQRAMKTTLKASSDPVPADMALDVVRDVVLGWSSGESAGTHDVYFGTVFDDVNDASRGNPTGVLVSQGQEAVTYDPAGLLDFGQTYYWRSDEVNATPDKTIFAGEVWSFTAEPFGYPVANIIATRNATSDPDVGPEKTVDGSGLNALDQHSTVSSDMWLGMPDGVDPIYLHYEFDRVYKLHEMLFWNYNVQFELMLGFGLRDVTIEHSENGTDWTVLGDVELAQAAAQAGYTANTTVDFGGAAVKYVRLTVNSGWGPLGQFGLSEVRFLYVPVQAREPQPADGVTDVSINATLSWRAGREAVSHELYLGTDPNALTLTDTPGAASYDPGTLNLGTAYYWKVDEVNEAEAVATWAGDVWSFATQEFLVVEDFESYTDDLDAGEAIFQSWIDGWENNTGSTVGHLGAPFAERTIIHSGAQSMPLFYDNTGLTTAEAEYTFAAQNWTASGIQSLSLFFAGDAGNSSGQLYLKINNTRVDYDGDPADITRTIWQAWNIDLSTVGGNLSSVAKLTIGIEGAGAMGVVYIDDIRLYPGAPEYITPVEPEATDLVAHYTFDEGAGAVVGDSSGNGNDGAINGDPVWTTGVLGGALEFSGDDYVDCGNDASLVIRDTITVACWIKVASFTRTWETIVAMGDDSYRIGRGPSDGDAMHFGCNGTTGGNFNGVGVVTTDTWHHVAGVYDGANMYIYVDGIEDNRIASTGQIDASSYNLYIGENPQATGRQLGGVVDDVRIYSRPLSPEEIAGLAGRTGPIHKPF